MPFTYTQRWERSETGDVVLVVEHRGLVFKPRPQHVSGEQLQLAYRILGVNGQRASTPAVVEPPVTVWKAAVEMPDYETTWIKDDHVFLAIRKERLDSDGLPATGGSADFLALNGFELVGSENGFLLYSSRPGDDNDTWRTWEAAWAFLAQKGANHG
jgi:hypothetical protein